MSKLQQLRIEKIQHVIKQYGFYHEFDRVISLWELAYNLNNTWQAKHFVAPQHLIGPRSSALPEYDTHRMFRAIRHAIRGTTHLTLRKDKHNGVEFVIA